MSDRWDAMLALLGARFPEDAPVAELTTWLAAEGLDERQIGEILARVEAERAGRSAAGGAAAGPAATPEADRPGAERPDRTGAEARPPLRSLALPVRVPGPHEWGRYTPEAWGRVLRLTAAGALAAPDLERVLDRALDHGGGRVDLAALHAVLDGVGLADAGADGDPTTIH